MNALPPNTRFRLYGATFQVDSVNGNMIRFHRLDDTYDVWELKDSWLMDKMRTGRLKVILDGNT